MSNFQVSIFLDNELIKDTPSKDLSFEDLKEAIRIAELDLEYVAIQKSLVTTYSYFYAKVYDTEAIKNLPNALVIYKPSFQYETIIIPNEIRTYLFDNPKDRKEKLWRE